MLVSRSKVAEVLERLHPYPALALDTETTGLRPFHGSRVFSLILAPSATEAYYFNFWGEYPDLDPEYVLPREVLKDLSTSLFLSPEREWFMHHARFDLAMLAVEGVEIAGPVFCTMTQGRVAYNEHASYALDASLERIGLEKDPAVEEWIEESGAWVWETIPGKNQRKKNKFFFQVPPSLIVPYGEKDARGTYALALHLKKEIAAQSQGPFESKRYPKDASRIEARLAPTIHRMERRGIRIDRAYCERATLFERGRVEKASAEFYQLTGKSYSPSPHLFTQVFHAEKAAWAYTEKGNPSFESDALSKFSHPAAKSVLTLRDAKAKLDFYRGFLYHADLDDVIHPQFHAAGTRTFRFSSSDPNLQNLTSEEDEALAQEFVVRRAFIPRPGHFFILPDFDQVEYRLMLDYAKRTAIEGFKAKGIAYAEDYFQVANRVAEGFDIHQATADLMGVSRKFAKTLNFLLLYGGGSARLADALGIPLEEAESLRSQYFRALPYVQALIASFIRTAETRGWVRNWAGYNYHFPNRNFSYTAPNTLIQGGCAAIIKLAMNEIDEYLLGKRSSLLLTIHDELVVEVSDEEKDEVPREVKRIMESIYPAHHVPLTVGMEYSRQSLADKVKGFPA